MRATIVSVNVGKAREVSAKAGVSGIFKEPAAGAVAVDAHGLANDAIIDTKHHGGLDQAVYAYCQSDYDWWAEQLGQPMEPGTFGENLTLSGIANADVAVGDRFACDTLTLEVTSPRIPCNTLAARMGDGGFVKKFYRANRSGFYCRVLKPGPIRSGTQMRYVPFSGERVLMTELMETYPYDRLDIASVARYLAAPIHRKLAARLDDIYGRVG
jgi:MOSC domain-containing protein YiiM